MLHGSYTLQHTIIFVAPLTHIACTILFLYLGYALHLLHYYMHSNCIQYLYDMCHTLYVLYHATAVHVNI